MNAIVNQPSDINFLSPLGFKFEIKKLPTFNYFVQAVDFPPFSLNNTNVIQTPFNRIITAGDHVTFNDLIVTFKIDENMVSYFEVYDWITALGKPDNVGQYAAIAKKAPGSGEGVTVDATLTVLNSAMQPNLLITFVDVIPASLSGFKFNSTDTAVTYLTATVTFKYREFIRSTP